MRVWLARIAGVLIAVALFLLVYAHTGAPGIRHDSMLDSIFDNRALIAGARLLAAVAMGYLLASIGVRVWKNQWVRNAGPVETDAPAQKLVDDSQDLRRQLREANNTIEDLRDRLERSVSAREAMLSRMNDKRWWGIRR